MGLARMMLRWVVVAVLVVVWILDALLIGRREA
jgi:hypothetical protein